MKSSGKMVLMIILKVTKKTGFHPVFRRCIGHASLKMGSNLPLAVLELNLSTQETLRRCYLKSKHCASVRILDNQDIVKNTNDKT